MMAAPREKTRTPGIYKRGDRYVFSYRVEGKQHWESCRTLDEARRAKATLTTQLLDQRVEVAAGVHKPLGDCTERDLAAAQDIMVEKMRLAGEVQAIVLNAAARGVSVPDDVRERIVAWDESLPALQQLRDTVVEVVNEPKGSEDDR